MSNYPVHQLNIIVKQICKNNNFKYTTYSDDWIQKIISKDKQMFIYGYNFPINDVVASKICCDKAATSTLLKANKILCFEHIYLQQDYTNEKMVKDIFTKMGNDVVVKPNDGTGGKDIFHCTSFNNLWTTINELFAHHFALAIAKYYDYDQEIRIVMLNNNIELAYQKEKKIYYGDGHSTVKEIIKDQNVIDLLSKKYDLNMVYKKDEILPFSWKHNIQQGAQINCNIDKQILVELKKIGINVCKALNTKLCSIDFAIINKKIYVVEVNNGIMLEGYSKHNKTTYDNSYKLYEKIIKLCLK